MDKHDTLLIACSTAEKRKILRDILRDYYYLLEANSPRQMNALLNQNRSRRKKKGTVCCSAIRKREN